MSFNLNGNAASVTSPSPTNPFGLHATITTTANNGSGLIRCTTSTPHNYYSNDFVYIKNVNTNTNSLTFEGNQITVIDATHFDIIGSTFSSAFSGTGDCYDLNMQPGTSQPLDGEFGTARSIEASIQCALDHAAFVHARIFPGYILRDRLTASLNGTRGTAGSNTGAWAIWTGSYVPVSTFNLGSFIQVEAGDIIVAEFSATLASNTLGAATYTQSFARLEFTENGGSVTKFAGSELSVINPSLSGNAFMATHLSGSRTVVTAGTFVISVNGDIGSVAAQIAGFGDYVLNAYRYQPTL